jgi:hypothetical protein
MRPGPVVRLLLGTEFVATAPARVLSWKPPAGWTRCKQVRTLKAHCHLTFQLTDAYTEFVGQPLGLRPALGRPVPVNGCLILPAKSGSAEPAQTGGLPHSVPHCASGEKLSGIVAESLPHGEA